MLDRGEINGLRWLLGLLTALAALLSVAGIMSATDPWIFACMALLATAAFCIRLLAAIPSTVSRVFLAVVFIHAGSDLFIHGSDVLPPIIRTLVILLSWRAVFQWQTAASGQVVLLALILVLVGGFFRPSPQFALALVTFTILALPLLWLQQYAKLMEDSVSSGRKCCRIRYPDINGMHDHSLIRVFLFGSGLYLLVTLIAAVLFVFLPRLDYGQSVGYPQIDYGQSQIGFTERLSFGDISNVLASDEKVMRIDTGSHRLSGLPYWRMLVLDEYQSDGFGMSEDLRAGYRELVNHRFSSQGDPRQGNSNPWTFYLEGGSSRFLPIPGAFDEIRMPSRQTLHFFAENLTFALAQAPAQTFIFRVDNPSHRDWFPGPDTLQEIPENQRSLDLENLESQKILERFVEEHDLPDWSETMEPGEFARQLIAAVQYGRGYSLQVQLPDGPADALLKWLEAGVPGHCEFYAGATVLVARALGAPARLIVGYIGGDWNGFEDYYMIRKRHAHAWVELWHPQTGWVRHEPTPITLIDGSEGGQDRLANLGDRSWDAYVDSLRFLWYQRVVRFDREHQSSLIQRGLDAARLLLDQLLAVVGKVVQGMFSLQSQSIIQLSLKWIFALFLFANIWLFRGELSRLNQWIVRICSPDAHWEQRMRQRADFMLRKYTKSRNSHLHQQLLRIRYGPRTSWPDPVDVFRELRSNSKR